MMYVRRFSLFFLMTMCVMAASTSVTLAQDPDNGKVLWEEQTSCQRCHGPAGEGTYSPPRAGDGKTAEEWITQVRTPRRFMPSFSAEQVTDEQITDMNAYMNSLPQPTEEFIPLDPGTAENAGQNLMLLKRCVACHTEANGEAGFLTKGVVKREATLTAEKVI